MKKIFKKILFAIALFILSTPVLSACSGSSDETSYNSFKICQEMEAFIRDAKASGLDKEIENKWLSTTTEKRIAYDELTGTRGTLNVGTYTGNAPMSYIENNRYAGVSIDWVYRFAKEYGYKMSIHDYSSVTAVIDAVINGKETIGGVPTTITEERQLSVSFTDVYCSNHISCATLKSKTSIYSNPEDLTGCSVGMISGTVFAKYINQDIKDVHIVEYNSYADLNQALRKNDIQAYYGDDYAIRYALLETTDVAITYDSEVNNLGFTFKKFGYQTLKELEKAKIGNIVGSIYGDVAKKALPNCTIINYYDFSSEIEAVKSNKIQALALEYPSIIQIEKNDNTMYHIHESIGSTNLASAFPKTDKGLANCLLFNSFINEIESNGTLDKLLNKWINYDDEKTKDTYLRYEDLKAINGKFILSVDASYIPFTFVKDNHITGLEVELFYEFCKKNGFSLKIENMSFGALIPSLSSNDAAACELAITEERLQSVYFSTSYYTCEMKLLCAAHTTSDKSFWEKVGDSFYKTFIKEERWKLFLEGIGNTVLITVCSILGGVLLGSLLYLFCKKAHKLGNILVRIYNSILHNIPIVVILMIFYYIFFGHTNISGIFVSILAFSCTFSTSIFAMLQLGISTIDKGQYEAAYALGYRKNQAFFKIILPQASRMFYPQLCGDVVSLLKETAVVGYIAVMDLTKVSDIIRSRTYEAFFPLIATAVIYFILAVILVHIVKMVQKYTDPRRRNRTYIKGVKNHD